MNDNVKKIINFRFDRYRDTEIKLEKLASKGLFLEECSSFFWTFRKDTPHKLKYTITYFSEGSVFNPDITNNQQTYFDYAASAGWHFVTGFNQIQVFCSEIDNPIPFETDEKEKLQNIKKCLNKSFIIPMIALILIFSFNLLIQFSSFQQNPIDFLSNSSRLLPVSMMLALIVYEVYSLINYIFWCRNSEKSIENGGRCIECNPIVTKTVDTIFIVFICANLCCFLLSLSSQINWLGLLLSISQVPILIVILGSSIKYLKKKKASATINKVISFTVLIIANFSYLTVIMLIILKFGFTIDDASTYRTVAWPIGNTYTHEYKLYSNKIPLTCEDLYGQTDYDYYSYESDFDSTLFLSKRTYRQNSLPEKESPPSIEYEILESQFDFVYQLSKNQLLKIPEWQNNTSYKPIDNNTFGTLEAYQYYYENTPTGEYILFFENKIISLHMKDPLSTKQIEIIKEKVLF